MKRMTIMLTAIMLIASTMAVSAVDSAEIRGSVQLVQTGTVSWDANTFAGFYYDLKDDIKTETLTMDITQGNELAEDTGVTYETTAQADDFDFEDWGQFEVIGFLGEKYFAGYVDGGFLDDESKDDSLLNDNQLSKVMFDDDESRTMTTATPLKLQDGYELAIKAIDLDGNKVYVELYKNGQMVDDAVVEPSKDGATMADKTYIYKTDLGDTSDIVLAAVHFKNAFRGAEEDLATIDGIFQISDVTMSVEEEDKYEKMEVDNVEAGKITMINSNKITLSKNKDLTLMGDVSVKTADSDDVPNRFYIYKEITEPGTYEVRGTVDLVQTGTVNWDANTFAGFYYDLKDDIKTETLTMDITQGNELAEDTGVTYETTAQADDFDFEDWGQFEVIGFLGEKYFAGYVDGGFLDDESKDDSLLNDNQLSKVMFDDDESRTMTTAAPLKLQDGYELAIKAIDLDGNKVYVELYKNGQMVDDAVVEPSKDGATMADKTYIYKTDLGDTSDIVLVAVHFKNAFRGAEEDLATIDGIFQISDATLTVEEEDKYGKMEVDNVEAGKITMINSNKITLSKNKDLSLMGDVSVKTADSDDVPNRFYIYKTVIIEGEVAPVVEEVAPVEEVVEVVEEAPVEEEVVVEEHVEEAPAEEAPAEEAKEEPGFEAVFAITGLLAVAYLVLRRK
jgi:S-layer protein (TIGR01567 family)